MTEKFINLSDERVSVDIWHNGGTVCDLSDILEAMEENDGDSILTCPIEGVVDALQDGQYLGKIDATQETIESLFNLISEQA